MDIGSENLQFDPDYILKKYLSNEYERHIPESHTCPFESDISDDNQRKASSYRPTKSKGWNIVTRNASTVSKEQVQMYFPGTEFECPTASQACLELVGTTEFEVLNDLLLDMKEKEFPISAKSVDDIIETAIPEQIKRHMNLLLSPMLSVLQSVPFRGSSIAELVDTYRRISAELYEYSAVSCPMGGPRTMMINFLQFMEYVLTDKKDDPNSVLKKFWVELMNSFQGEFSIDHVDQQRLRMHVFANGNTKQFPLRMDVQETPKEKAALYPASGETHTGVGTTCIKIDCRPDIVLTGTSCVQSVQITETHPIIIVEIKASKFTSCKHRKPMSEQHSIEAPHVLSPKHRGSNILNPDCLMCDKQRHQQRIDCVETQHFLQLLATLRAIDALPGEDRSGRVHAIGLYIVNHLVYVTGLYVVIRDNRKSFGESLVSKLLFVNRREFITCTNKNFRMVCTKPFNMLKSAHFKALIRYIQYVVCKYDEKL